MNAVRYVLLALLTLAPVCAFAQGPDSVHVEYRGVEYPGYGANFGQPFVFGEEIGPLPLVTVESGPTGEFPDSPPDEGCNPYTPESAAEVEGNIAIVQRGVCTFVLKVQNAVAAGAVAVVVYNDEREGPESETLVQMGGDCEPEEGCTIPSAFISRASGLAILTELEFGGRATIIPIRVEGDPPCDCGGGHNTGTVQFDVYDHGFLGADPQFSGIGFVFGGVNGLFVSTVLVGVDGNVVSNPYDGVSEWRRLDAVMALPAPFPEPFDDFDQGFLAVFENADLGIRVTERSYSRAGDDFVIVELEVLNISGSDIEDVYVGIFADWDAGTTTSTDDRGGVDEELNLVYVYDPVEAGPYFGVSMSEKGIGPLSGYSTDATMGTDAQLWEALTTEVEPGAEPAERAAVTGTGPYDLAAGSSQTVRFAFIAGVDEADLLANARRAQLPIATAAEATPAATFALGAAYPNPFSSRTTVSFTLPTAQRVRLAVYDVLGREVAALVDGVRAAGEQTVAFDAAGLPSGVYLYRLEAGGTVLTQRLTLVR